MPSYQFASASSPGVTYTVLVSEDGTKKSCNCPGWTKRVQPDGSRTCKHLALVPGKQTSAKPVARDRGANLPTGYRPEDKVPAGARIIEAGRGFVQPMLACPMPEGCSLATYEGDPNWWMERKEDGHRVIITTNPTIGLVVAWSRPRAGSQAGLQREIPGHILAILKAFPHGTWDGELIAPGGKSWNVTEATNWSKLRLVLFDVLGLDGQAVTSRPAEWRRKRLEAVGTALKNKKVAAVCIAEAWPVSRAVVERIWKDGGEGVILKRRTATYQPGKRSADWIKVKRVESLVCTIVGFLPGKNGPYSTVEVRLPGGGTTTVKTKDAAHLRMFEENGGAFRGRQLRIEHQGLFDGKPRHPMFDHLLDAPKRGRR